MNKSLRCPVFQAVQASDTPCDQGDPDGACRVCSILLSRPLFVSFDPPPKLRGLADGRGSPTRPSTALGPAWSEIRSRPRRSSPSRSATKPLLAVRVEDSILSPSVDDCVQCRSANPSPGLVKPTAAVALHDPHTISNVWASKESGATVPDRAKHWLDTKNGGGASL